MTNETEPTVEERAMFIGERLFPLRCNHVNQKKSFPKWLSSISGLDSVEREMIERGYDIVVGYLKEDESPWECCIYGEFYRDQATPLAAEAKHTKSEAILTTVYRALKGEVE